MPGVTSISADVHKYGYTFKGASVVALPRPGAAPAPVLLVRRLARRPLRVGHHRRHPSGGAHRRRLGGHQPPRRRRLPPPGRPSCATPPARFHAGIDAIDGVRITHEPDLSVMRVHLGRRSTSGPSATCMDDRGWNLDRQQGGLHLMISPYHAKVADRFLADLADAVANHGESRGKAASYGGVV